MTRPRGQFHSFLYRIHLLCPNNYFSTGTLPIIMIQERFYSCRSFAPVMVRSPIPKEPPTMDLTLTLVAGLKIGIPICIKKRRGISELYTVLKHSFSSVILVTSQSIRFSEKFLEMLRNERFSAGLIALQR